MACRLRTLSQTLLPCMLPCCSCYKNNLTGRTKQILPIGVVQDPNFGPKGAAHATYTAPTLTHLTTDSAPSMKLCNPSWTCATTFAQSCMIRQSRTLPLMLLPSIDASLYSRPQCRTDTAPMVVQGMQQQCHT